MSHIDDSPFTTGARTSTRLPLTSSFAPPPVNGGARECGSFDVALPIASIVSPFDLLQRATRNLEMVCSEVGSVSSPASRVSTVPPHRISLPTHPRYSADPQTVCQPSVGSLGDVGGPLYSAHPALASSASGYSPFDPSRRLGSPPLPTRVAEAAGSSSDAPAGHSAGSERPAHDTWAPTAQPAAGFRQTALDN